jgi:hypothetical protein
MRWIGWVLVLAVVGGLVTFAVIEGDKLARGIATDAVRSGVVTALQLPATQEVEVELADGLLLFQAIGGSIETADVHLPGLSLGSAVGDLDLVLGDIPLDPTKPFATLDAALHVDEANMLLWAPTLSGAPLTGVTLGDGAVLIAADLGGVPVTAALAPTLAAPLAESPDVARGLVVFTPGAVTEGGVASSIEAILAGPLAPAAAPLLTSAPLCAASLLPKVLHLDAVTAADGRFSITGTATEVRFSNLAGTGVCDPPPAAE